MTSIKFKKLNIEAYKPGKSNVRKLKKIIKLSANESALGVSARVKKVMSKKNINFFAICFLSSFDFPSGYLKS